MKAIRIYVTGKVQGVFFRQSVKEVADNLNINGFVQNRSDGSVYIEAEADEDSLKKLIQWCHNGPPASTVEKVDVTDSAATGFTKFIIRYGE